MELLELVYSTKTSPSEGSIIDVSPELTTVALKLSQSRSVAVVLAELMEMAVFSRSTWRLATAKSSLVLSFQVFRRVEKVTVARKKNKLNTAAAGTTALIHIT